MSDYSLPEVFHLMQGETLLAVLKQCEPIEMFWLGCIFEPEPVFAEVEYLFRDALSALDDESTDQDIFDECYKKIHALGIVLYDPTSKRIASNFFMHIQEDSSVHIRFSFDD